MKKIFFLSIIIALVNFSCESYVEDINVSPHKLTDASAENLIQGVMLANQFFHTSSNVRDAMIWINQANGEDRQYLLLNDWNNSTTSNFDDAWSNAYVNVIANGQIAASKAAVNGNPRLQGVAQVLIAHTLGAATSLWGDVPYREANNPLYTNPAYDPQAQVYADLQILLDNAITNLSKTNGSGIPLEKEIYYGPSALATYPNNKSLQQLYITSRWIKLAHSLKARYYLHVKDYPQAKSEALLGINTKDDDFIAQFGNTYLESFNPFYSFIIYDRDTYISGSGNAYDILNPLSSLYKGNAKTDESARFAFNYTDLSGDGYYPESLNIYGGDYGGTNGKFGSDSNMPLITNGEMLLIIAEADARASFATGLTSYNVYRALLNTGYSIGINNNGYDSLPFKYDSYVAADFNAGGIENVSGSLTNQNALLREIYQERYIYFIGNFEAFTDFRRTNNIAEIKLKTGNVETPQRFLYPQVEIDGNTSVPKPTPKIVEKTPVHL